MRGTARIAGAIVTGGVRATVSTEAPTLPAPTLPAMEGLIRGATDTRDSTCRLGERIKPCAWTGEPAREAKRQANGNPAAVSLAAVLIGHFLTARIIGPQTLRKNARRRHGVSTARLTIFSFCSFDIR